MGWLSKVKDFIWKPKPYAYPPGYGYPEPMLVGQLLDLLRRYIPPTTEPEGHPEWTPVKVHLPLGQGLHKVFDVAYVGHDGTQIVLTLRVEVDAIGGV